MAVDGEPTPVGVVLDEAGLDDNEATKEQIPPAYLEKAVCNVACRCPMLNMPICVVSVFMKPFNLILQCIAGCINCMVRCWTRCVQCIKNCILSLYRCICVPIIKCLRTLLYYLLCIPCIGAILKCCIAILVRFLGCCRVIIKCLVCPLKAVLACMESCCAALWKCMKQCVVSLWHCTTKCLLAVVCCPVLTCNKLCNPKFGCECMCGRRSRKSSKTSEVETVETTEEETATVCCGGSAPGCVCIFPLEFCGVGVTCPYSCCSFGCTHCFAMPPDEKKYWKQKGKAPAGELPKVLAAACLSLVGGLYALLCLPFKLLSTCMVPFKGCTSSCAPVKEAMKSCLGELDVCIAPCFKVGHGCKVISADCHLGCSTVCKPCAPFLILLAPVLVPMKFVFKLGQAALRPVTKRMTCCSKSSEPRAPQDLEKGVTTEAEDIKLAVAVEQEKMEVEVGIHHAVSLE